MRKIRGRLFGMAAICQLALAVAVTAAEAGPEERRTMSHRWSVEAAYPQFHDPKVDAAIREWLDARIAGIIDNAKEHAGFNERDGHYDVAIDYKVSRPSDLAASVLFDMHIYSSGAAHGGTAREAKNIRLADASFLGLDDLFRDPDKALEILSRHAKAGVEDFLRNEKSSRLEERDATDLYDGDWLGEGSAPTRENYSCLTLLPNGVTVHFQEYQVAAYAFGAPEYVVTLEQLAPAGPSRKIWPDAP